jgi:hypothetical protein
LTSDGRIAVHDSAYGECAGSRESRDLTAKMAAIVSKAKAPSADVLAAARPIVRALTPAGRTNRRESEDELRHRFAEDGAEIDKKYFNAALAVLEENGHAGGCDAGRLPGCRTGLSGPSPSCLRRGVIPGRSVRWCWRIYGLIDDLPDL